MIVLCASRCLYWILYFVEFYVQIYTICYMMRQYELDGQHEFQLGKKINKNKIYYIE